MCVSKESFPRSTLFHVSVQLMPVKSFYSCSVQTKKQRQEEEQAPRLWPCSPPVRCYQKLLPHVFTLSLLTFILRLLFPFVPATAGNGTFVFGASVFLRPGISKHLFACEPKIPVKLRVLREPQREAARCPPRLSLQMRPPEFTF